MKESAMTEDRRQIRLTGELTEDDEPWLVALGIDWPSDGPAEAWLAQLNDLVAVGSQSAHCNRRTVEARQQFLATLRALDPDQRTAYTRDRPWETPTDTFIMVQRALYNLGIDHTRQLNSWFCIVKHTPERILGCAQALSRHGIEVCRVADALPVVFSYAPESLTAKIEHLRALGLDPVRVIHHSARVLSCSPKTLSDRLAVLTARGLDGVAMVNRSPTLLGHAASAVNERLTVIYAAARSWGIEYAAASNAIEGWPLVLGYKADRLRTLVRLLSHAVPEPTKEPLRTSHVSQLGALSLDHVLAGYFTHQREIRHRNDLRFYSKQSQARGKAHAQAVIAQNRSHPVLKYYWRAYPDAAAERAS
jgi:hypothetical protein